MKKNIISGIVSTTVFTILMYGYDYYNNQIASLTKYVFLAIFFMIGIFLFDFLVKKFKK